MAFSRRQGQQTFNDSIDDALEWGDLGEEPIYIPMFAPGRPLDDNVFCITRPLWGKPRAEWAMCLARDLVRAHPAADTSERQEWTAAILWAVAIDTGMDKSERWQEVIDDVTSASGVDEVTTRAWFERLKDRELERPKNPPVYWID